MNAGRQQRLAEELPLLRPLPARRLESCQRRRVRVDSGSTIPIARNTYSVASRLIGEWVEARLYADHIEVWYAQRQVEHLPRLRGRGNHRIDYRHIIDWLVRKPRAFADYCYRDDLFPSSRFRLVYDRLVEQQPERAAKEYVRILYLAARESEAGVEAILEQVLRAGGPWSAAAVAEALQGNDRALSVTEVVVAPVDLAQYDALLEGKEAEDGARTEREEPVAGVPEGTAPADRAGQLRGVGPEGPAGGTELRALPAGTGAARNPGPTERPHRLVAAAIAVAAGEELAGPGPEASAAEGAATGPSPAGGGVQCHHRAELAELPGGASEEGQAAREQRGNEGKGSRK